MNEGSIGKLIVASIHIASVDLGIVGGVYIGRHPAWGALAMVGAVLFGIGALCRGWILESENAELKDALMPTRQRIVGPLPSPRMPSVRPTVEWGPSRHSIPHIPLPVFDPEATKRY